MKRLSREKQIVRASWVAIVGNAILSLLKIGIGIFAGSLAVVGDGIDSGVDVAMSIITLFTAKIMNKKPNVKYPYGYEKADTMASKALSFLIFFAGAQLMISTISDFFNNSVSEMPSPVALYVTVFSIFGKLFLSWYQKSVGRKINSKMLISNGINMQNDVLISISVLIGVGATLIFNSPIIDRIAALAVSIWILKVAFDLFMETNAGLLDGVQDESVYEKIFDAIDSVEGVINPHRVRTREFGGLYVIDLDIEVNSDLTIREGHDIAQKVEESIKKKIENVYDIIVHVEPAGEGHSTEKYGVTREDI